MAQLEGVCVGAAPSAKQCGWTCGKPGNTKEEKAAPGWEDTTTCLPERFSQVSKGDGYATCQGVACASIAKEDRICPSLGKKVQSVHTLGELKCIKKPTPDYSADECHTEAEEGKSATAQYH